MATIQQNLSDTTGNYFQGTSTKNNGGSIIAGGSNSSVVSKQNPKGSNVGVFGSVVVESAVVGNTKAVSGGVFAHQHIKPIAARVTTELAGVASTAITDTGDTVTRSINKLESVVTNKTATAFRAGNFNLYTGKYANGSVLSPTDSFGNDVAANPTTLVPGRLTYMLGKSTPVVTSYKEKH